MAHHSQRVHVRSKSYVVEGRRVGKGQFAEVFRARDANPSAGDDGLVALKVERDDATLMHEYKVLKVRWLARWGTICPVHQRQRRLADHLEHGRGVSTSFKPYCQGLAKPLFKPPTAVSKCPPHRVKACRCLS
jgi:hypothetical protein